ncbi:hypothetical protein R1flu_004478 [Riccia fluitans]|uniref:Glycosyltransferase n=1 Tax=Riccia fluitans TaxID=41844 RepID=A0ABD1YRD7_9MARC
MGSVEKWSPKVLIIPIEAQGHWAPVLPLLHQLVLKKIGFTVLTTAERCDELRSYGANGAYEGVEVEFLEVFTDPSTKGLGPLIVPAMMKDFESYRGSGGFDRSKYTCMIADMFLYFCQDLADEWGIPTYCLITSPSYFALVMLHGDKLVSGGWTPFDVEKRDKFIELPGLENFKGVDVPQAVVHLQPNAFEKFPSATRRAAGLLINSFQEFDGKSADNLRHQLQSNPFPGKGVPKVYLIGPLLLLPGLSGSSEVKKRVEENESIFWLDKQEMSSVLFICFGSVRALDNRMVSAVAKALEDTGVPFIWALRLPPDQVSKDNLLPRGFEERTQGRGLVLTSWVPQKEILLHPSVGGFLSHCGYNSVMESMLGGVPIAGFPIYAEQGMNARHMVNELKAAVEIKGRIREFEAEEIAVSITKLMKGKEGKEARTNMHNLRKSAYAAVAERGSSLQNLQAFLAEILEPSASCS